MKQIFRHPPKCPEIISGQGIKGVAVLLKFLVERKVYNQAIGIEENETKEKLTGIAERIRDRF
jgi:hypothetical protein